MLESLSPGQPLTVWAGNSKGYAYSLAWKLRTGKIVDLDFGIVVKVLPPLDPLRYGAWTVVVERV